ncbi:MAG: transposase, partial [Bacteroidales bacterium]|nr:transposase [Bacteroidales bacterium]
MYFILSGLRKSISTEINNFIEEHSNLDFPRISKQAFSKARQNISPKAFKALCSVFVDSFYNSNTKLNKWPGFNVFAVDGTTLQIPDTQENIEYFGASKNQSSTQTALASASASASAIYDVLNDIVIDAIVEPYKKSEREMAKQHINSIKNAKLLNKSIVIFDRGYPSYDM